ncbi:MAG: DUF4923 family protein [Bacteroidales bacterium]|nr:DUF4923 family protein [Bacteroidales bacterium]
MKKISLILSVAAMLFSTSAIAQTSLKDLLSSKSVQKMVNALTQGQAISQENVIGGWDYTTPAVALKSDNALSTAAATVAASTIENKISSYYNKAGIKPGQFGFTFNDDNTFVMNYGNRRINGNYSVTQDGTIQMQFGSTTIAKNISLTAYPKLTTTTMQLVFNADKLLTALKKIASLAQSDSTLSTLTTLLESYNGVNIGFNLNRLY